MGIYESFDNRVTADFSAGTVGTASKYISVNGYTTPTNSFTAQPAYPYYFDKIKTLAVRDRIQISCYFYVPSLTDDQTYGLFGIVLSNVKGGTRYVLHAGPWGQGVASGNLGKTSITLYSGIFNDVQSNSSGISYLKNEWYHKVMSLTKNISDYTISCTITKASDGTLIHQGSYTTNVSQISNATWFTFGGQDGHGSGSPGYRFDEVKMTFSWEHNYQELFGV